MTTPRDTPASRRTRANGDGTVYQRKDSRWEAAGYVLAPGNTRKRIRVYGTTRKEALAKLTEKIAASNRGVPVVTAQGSLAAYLTYWLENVAVHHLRENTHTRYTAVVQPLPHPRPGPEEARQAHRQGRPHLAQPAPHHLPVLRTRHRRRARDQPPLLRRRPVLPQAALPADAGLHPLRTQVRPGARRPRGGDPAQRRPQRPHRHTPPPPLRTPHRRRGPRSSSPPPSGHRLHALFELALRTGLRKGELLGLRWEDLDLDSGTASIRRTLQRTNTRRPDRPAHQDPAAPSAASPCPPQCLQLPASSTATGSAGNARAAGTELEGQRLRLHHGPTGTPIEPATLTRHFNTLLREASLRRIRFHDLRHSTATLLLEQGVELVVIKELLGHAHIGVTATVYAHVRLRLQRDAIDLLGHALRTPAQPPIRPDDGDEPPLCAAPVR